VKKTALSLLLAICLAPAAALAQVGIVVRVAPPAPIVEHYGPPPHEGWVWIDGYHRWNGHRYVWVHGHWVRPRIPARPGLPIAGSSGAMAGSSSKATGGKPENKKEESGVSAPRTFLPEIEALSYKTLH